MHWIWRGRHRALILWVQVPQRRNHLFSWLGQGRLLQQLGRGRVDVASPCCSDYSASPLLVEFRVLEGLFVCWRGGLLCALLFFCKSVSWLCPRGGLLVLVTRSPAFPRAHVSVCGDGWRRPVWQGAGGSWQSQKTLLGGQGPQGRHKVWKLLERVQCTTGCGRFVHGPPPGAAQMQL